MRIGIVGSDDRAKAIGRLFHRSGHQVTFGDPNATERAQRIAADVGAGYAVPYKQAMCSELLMLTIPRRDVDRAVTAVGSTIDAIVVDAVSDERGNGAHSGAEMLAHKLDSRRLVRALINMPQSGANISICGDDPGAKAVVDRALHECGCVTTDRGPLANAVELEAPAAVAA